MPGHPPSGERFPGPAVRSDRSNGEVLDPEVLPRLPPWLEKLSWLMDSSIPIGRRWSIGLDGLIGLVPGVGDLVGALVGVVVIGAAVRAGVPRATVFRMAVNAGVDALLGLVPVAGDVADLAFKSNTRNLRLFRESLAGRREPVRDWTFVGLALLAGAALVAAPLVLLILLIRSF